MSGIQNVIKIRSCERGWLIRNKNLKLKDNMNFEILNLLLDNYNEKIKLNEKVNKLLSKKKIRNDNFPSEISENIVKFVFAKKYKMMPSWDTKRGDLEILGKQIEVKAFSSDGPSSFGPSEKWDILYFVDCKQHLKKVFKVYEINISSESDKWKSIKVNKNQSFEEQCNQKRRPRICFNEIRKQLSNNCKLIFEDHLDQLMK